MSAFRHSLPLAALFVSLSVAGTASADCTEFLDADVVENRLLLDWSTEAREPARFRILHPDGRLIAQRDGKRSVQGWLISLRVAGWPAGSYRVEAEAGDRRASAELSIR